MAYESSNTGTNKSAMFMSYLGQQLNLIYGISSTGGYYYKTQEVLNLYDIIRDESYNYDGETVLYSLESGNPVLISARSTLNTGHMFIIDGYQKQIDRTYASFVWDGSYKYTQEDIMNCESWRFSDNIEFMDEKGEYAEKELYVNNYTYIAMNWGWNGIGDDTYYLASKRTAPDTDETYIEPYWRAASNSIYNEIKYVSSGAYVK